MFIKASFFGVLTLLSTTSAFALTCVNDYSGNSSCANNTQAAGDCETLGYSKSNVDGCEHYLYCPFDTSYKRCVKEDFCNGFTLSSCPTGAESCSSCGKSGSLKYKVNSCKSGYTLSGDTCVANSCSGYTLTNCPTGSGADKCSTCLSGTTTKYKIDSCKSGYSFRNGSCVLDVRDCTDADSKYLGDPGYTCPAEALECEYCKDKYGDIRLVLTKCPVGSLAAPTGPACERYCPEIMTDYYTANNAPINKKVVDSCRYYDGTISGKHTTYYKFDKTSGCNRSYNCTRSFITSGSGSYYQTSCSMTYGVKGDNCTFGYDYSNNTCQENQQVTITTSWNGYTTTSSLGFGTYVKKCKGEEKIDGVDTGYGCQEELDGNWIPEESIHKASCYDSSHTCTYNNKTYYHDC